MIETAGLTVRAHGRDVLRDVSLAVPSQSTTVLLGGNGSGKSALLEAAVGHLKVKAGSIRVMDLDPGHAPSACEIRRSCGYVPQSKALYNNFSVREMCRFSSTFFPTWQKHIEDRLLDRFEISPHRDVRDLSANKRALFSTALALMHKPPLLLLDEPFDDLDPAASESLLQALIEAAGEGATLVIATNNPERVDKVADQALFFRDGCLALSAQIDDLKHNWKAITAHFAEDVTLPALPVSGVEFVTQQGRMVEWVVSKNASEVVGVIQSLGAMSVQVENLSLYSLFSRLPK